MIHAELTQSKIQNALPENFQLYHLGTVRSNQTDALFFKTGFHHRIFLDDGSVLSLLTLFEDSDVPSQYIEAGNLVTSIVANELGHAENTSTIMISPPEEISPLHVERLVKRSPFLVEKSYTHEGAGGTMSIHVMVFPSISLGVANA